MSADLRHREVHRREQEFHDALATSLSAAARPPRPPDKLERVVLDLAGDVRGRRVLELGCGVGDLTLQLAERGAVVTALDLSSAMVNIAQNRVMRFMPNASATFLATAVEHTPLPADHYELVVGKWILHHADICATADEVHRVLRPGGRAVFAENSGLNPLLLWARRWLAGRFGIPRYGTEDEHPLVAKDYQYYGALFQRVDLHFPDFCFFALLDRQLLHFHHPRATRLLSRADAAVWRVRALRRYSYHVVLTATKQMQGARS